MPTLTCFASDDKIRVDHEAAERTIHSPDFDRQNCLFAGSAAGRKRAATYYKTIETSKPCDLDPEAYRCNIPLGLAWRAMNRQARNWNRWGIWRRFDDLPLKLKMNRGGIWLCDFVDYDSRSGPRHAVAPSAGVEVDDDIVS